MVEKFQTNQKQPMNEVLAFSDRDEGFEQYKMSRAQFLMSQIDLDPIESHHS